MIRIDVAPPVRQVVPFREAFSLREMISRVAKKTFVELGASLGCAALCAPFAESRLVTGLLFGGIVVQMGLTKAIESTLDEEELEEAPLSTRAQAILWGRSIPFLIWSFQNFVTVVHEGGHALAAELFFTNSNPKITVGLLSGQTLVNFAELSSLGKDVGQEAAVATVVGAGPAMQQLLSILLLGTGLSRKSRVLVNAGLIASLHNISYAFTAIPRTNSSSPNDFIVLKNAGVDPAFTIITISGSCLLLYLSSLACCQSERPWRE